MLNGSVQSRAIKVEQIPLKDILRPIPPVIDHAKVDSMVETLKGQTPSYIPTPAPERIEPGQLPPVDVLQYKSSSGNVYNFAFGGCHRFQAYEKAGEEMVNCKVLKVTKQMLKVYLGGSVDAIINE